LNFIIKLVAALTPFSFQKIMTGSIHQTSAFNIVLVVMLKIVTYHFCCRAIWEIWDRNLWI